jgi:hypothetical protein
MLDISRLDVLNSTWESLEVCLIYIKIVLSLIEVKVEILNISTRQLVCCVRSYIACSCGFTIQIYGEGIEVMRKIVLSIWNIALLLRLETIICRNGVKREHINSTNILVLNWLLLLWRIKA